MKSYTSIEDQVLYGLETVDQNRTVEVSLKDLIYIHQALGEYVRYFHQPEHYKSIQDIEKFLGSVDENNGYKVLHEAYYKKIRGMIPKDIEELFGEGEVFENPNPPFYFNRKE